MFSKLSTTISILLTLTIIILAGLAFYIYQNPKLIVVDEPKPVYIYKSKFSDVDLEFQKFDRVSKQVYDVADVYISGWIPDWDMQDGLQTLRNNNGNIDSVSPVWYFVDPDGSLRTVNATNNSSVIGYARQQGLELIPTIQDFDGNNMTLVLNNPENLQRHVDQIVNVVVNNNYDGIDLDYEAFYLKDRGVFFEMMEKVSVELKKHHKKFVFTVLPKWGDEIYYTSSPQTRRTHDFLRISEYVDELRVMTYDLFGRDTKIGPNAPVEWMERVTQYMISLGIPRNKIVLGLHTYSYDWVNKEVIDTINLKDPGQNYLNTTPTESAVALYNISVNKIKRNYNYTEIFNDEWGEMVLYYTYEGQGRTVIYPNEKSFDLRKKLAAEYGIKGVAYWRFGDEDGMRL